ncbi:prepilin peptidase [Terricaulis sp.]|uniref:prepilin peptidase n=1 Tax=Terricaulis sp. TaxID=2768686 RepID=UPI0037843C84
MIEIASLVAFVGLLATSAWWDVTTMTIPNWISIALTALFPVVALATGMPMAQIGLHLAFGLAILVICFILFQINIMGGGDAKMIAATAVWTGLGAFAPFIVWMAIFGGVIAMTLLMVRKKVRQGATQPAFVNRLLKPRGGVPYGVAILAGGLMALHALPFAATPLTTP